MSPSIIILSYGLLALIVISVMTYFIWKEGQVGNPMILKRQVARGAIIIILYGLLLMSLTRKWPIGMSMILIVALGLTAIIFDRVSKGGRR